MWIFFYLQGHIGFLWTHMTIKNILISIYDTTIIITKKYKSHLELENKDQIIFVFLP